MRGLSGPTFTRSVAPSSFGRHSREKIERFSGDPEGQAITASLIGCAMPRFDIIRDFVHVLDQSVPCKNKPLGVKGAGQLGTICATPAVVNTVADALSRAGRADNSKEIQMPMTRAKGWQALQ